MLSSIRIRHLHIPKAVSVLVQAATQFVQYLGELKSSRSLWLILLANVTILLYPQISHRLGTSDSSITINHVDQFERISPLVNEWLIKSYFPTTNATIHSNSSDIDQFVYSQLHKEYDPRLLPALWINSIFNDLQHDDDSVFNPDITLPFSWSSLLGVDKQLKGVSLGFDLSVLNCEKFADAFNLDYSSFSKSCVSLRSSPRGYPKFKITSAIDCPMSEEGRKIIGLSYLLHESSSIPNRLVLVGAGPNSSSLSIPFFHLSKTNAYSKADLQYLITDYIDNLPKSNSLTNSITLSDELIKLNSWWDNLDQTFSYKQSLELQYDIFRAIDTFDTNRNVLNKEDFDIDMELFINSLRNKVTRSYNNGRINDFDKDLLSVINENVSLQPNFTKYFHEAHCYGTKKGSHYDWRFFKQIRYSEYERKAILHRLTRAWLRFASSVGLSTWLGHGSLLGWYWNGMSLPWDEDLDVQMTTKSLFLLARNFNQTLVVDLIDDNNDLNNAMGSYLVDVSSNFFSREKGNGFNTIDARFIDTTTGFYVDITALSLTNSSNSPSSNDKKMAEFNQMLDSEFIEKERSQTVSSEDLQTSLAHKKLELMQDRNLFNCRNDHFYTLENLSPLKQTWFEGVKAYVPSEYKNILEREYTRSSLFSKQYEGHTFRPMLDLWIPSKICKRDSIGNQCFENEVLLERKHTQTITSRHRQELRKYQRNENFEEVLPFRTDPWIIQRCLRLQQLLEQF